MPLVRVETEDGHVGWGEGWSRDNDTAPFHAQLARAAPTLVGADAGAIAAVHARLWSDAGWAEASVASAIDLALWDRLGQARAMPLHALLGAASPEVPVYASGGLYRDGQTPEALAAELAAAVAQGHRAVKLKIGAHGFDDDLARVTAVRAAVGPDVTMWVDALGRLPPDRASVWIDALAGLGVAGLQAPLPLADVAGLAAAQRAGRVAVIAGEAGYRADGFAALIDRHAVGVLQLNPGLCGGITGALHWAALARQAGIGMTPQCHGTAVLQAACLHLGAGRADVPQVEYHLFHTHLHQALPQAMRQVRDGMIRLDDRPGLGLDIAAVMTPAQGTLREIVSVDG